MKFRIALWSLLMAPALLGQQPRPAAKKPFQAQSSSTVSYKAEGSAETIDLTNVTYQVTASGIPGRPADERLLLRKTTRTKQVLDEIGIEATTTIEAWPVGTDVKDKPLYSLNTAGDDPTVLNSEIIVISRGLEETEWWSAYKLGNGQHLFDTYTPVAQFSISRDVQQLRYVGFEVPPDDSSDKRLKAPNVVGVLTYASGERVIREALITADDPKLAKILRSYADSGRTVAGSGSDVRVTISRNYPSAPQPMTIVVPITRDDLDVARSQTPPGVHVAAWKR